MKKYLKALVVFSLTFLCIELAHNKTTEFICNTFSEKENVAQVDTIRGAEYNVTVTMYYAVVGQCDNSPLITADGSKINPKKASEHKWIAVSQDMLKKNGGQLEYGDFVEIKGTGEKDGVYQVHDCMNKRFKNYIDILETEGAEMYKYKNITLTQVSWNSTTPTESLLASL